MTLDNLWYNETLEKYRIENNLESLPVWRVIAKHKTKYVVKTDTSELDADIIGKIRYEKKSNAPQVWDWVAVSLFDENNVSITNVYPRYSTLSRQKTWAYGEEQIIATNIDYGLIVFAVNRDFSLNRIERYLTICHSSNITPIVLLSKIDLIDKVELEDLLKQIRDRIKDIEIIAISNESKYGLKQVYNYLKKGKTYCLLGSSGVGKSTLINNLVGKEIMKTGDISEFADRWIHVTTHREIIVLENGGIIIDNPGMRELWITDDVSWLDATFEYITQLSNQCKYKDCCHDGDQGCEIDKALKSWEIDKDSYMNFQKLQKENDHYNKTKLEKKRDGKKISQIHRSFKKQSKRGDY